MYIVAITALILLVIAVRTTASNYAAQVALLWFGVV